MHSHDLSERHRGHRPASVCRAMVNCLVATAALLVLAACSDAVPSGSTNRAPSAAFTVSTAVGPAPLTVEFDARASSDTDGVIVAFAWDFGDGETGAGATTAHTFLEPGDYTTRLTVRDDGGAIASAQRVITVTGGGDGGTDPGDGGGTDPGDGGGGADPSGGISQTTFTAVFAGSESALSLVDFASNIAISTVYEASIRNGGALTLTGSVSETSPETFAYAADLSDRLRLSMLDGREYEIVFNATPEGDYSGDAARFLRNPHRIDMRFTSNVSAGALDLAIASQPGVEANTQVASVAGGFTTTEGVRWSVDLALEGFQRSVVEFGGNEREVIGRATGQAHAEALDVLVTLNRYYRYILVNTTENIDQRFDHTLQYGGRTYRFAGRAFIGLKDSQPVDRDQWVISGGLFDGETPVATLAASEDVRGLTIWLDFGGGERTQLLFFGYL